MKAGEKYRIYDDPISRNQLEGVATLVDPRRIHSGYHLAFWRVRFQGERRSVDRWVDDRDKATNVVEVESETVE